MFCFRSKISGVELLLFEETAKGTLPHGSGCSFPCPRAAIVTLGDDPYPPGLLHQRCVLHDLVLARSVCVQFRHELASAHYSDPMAHSQQFHQVG